MDTQDLQHILNKYTKFHNLSDDYFSIMNDNDLFSLKDKNDILTCGDILGFNSDNELVNANFCRKRICPMCQWRKAEKTFSQFIRLSDILTNE